MTKKALRVFEAGVWAALAFACAVTVSSCPTSAHAQVVGQCKPGGQCKVGTLATTSTANACFVVDSSVIFVDCANNRVGINDSTPSVALDVTGTMNITGDVVTSGGNVTVPSNAIIGVSGTTHGFIYDNTNLQFRLSNASYGRINNSTGQWTWDYHGQYPSIATTSTSTNPAALSVPTNGYISFNGANAGAGAYITSAATTVLSMGVSGASEVTLSGSNFAPVGNNGNTLGEASLQWLDAYLAVGTSTQETRANGYVTSQVTTVGNVGTGEDTLFSQTIAGNALTTTGRGLKIFANGNIANNANSKTLIFYWGATSCSTALNIPVSINSAWRFTGYLYRTGSNTQRIVCTWEGTNGATGLWAWVLQSTNSATETESGSVDIRITGQSSAASDNDVEIYTALIENI